MELRFRRSTPPSTERSRVRRATLSDVPTVVMLRLALLREYEHHPFYGPLRPDAEWRATELYRGQLLAPDQAIFLADRGGESVGIIRCVETVASPLFTTARYCYVSSAYVAPTHRRTGVLHALLAEVERWAIDRGLGEIRLHNSASHADAIATWDALGFHPVEQVRYKRLF